MRADVDVLVIGGGPAGCWAAIAAAEAGASVALVDKGYCGTSGAAASAGVAIWYVEPEREARANAISSREALGGWLVDRRWMRRVLDETTHRCIAWATGATRSRTTGTAAPYARACRVPSTCVGCADR